MVTVPRSSRMGCSCAVHAALTRGTGAHRAGADPSPTHSRCTYPGGRRRQPPSSDLSCAVFFRSCPAGWGRTGSAAKRIVAAESRAKKKKKSLRRTLLRRRCEWPRSCRVRAGGIVCFARAGRAIVLGLGTVWVLDPTATGPGSKGSYFLMTVYHCASGGYRYYIYTYSLYVGNNVTGLCVSLFKCLHHRNGQTLPIGAPPAPPPGLPALPPPRRVSEGGSSVRWCPVGPSAFTRSMVLRGLEQ